ncbi:MAG: hypothetical protein PHX78_10300 [bacterium]|nr:hypothetical protein [bacterium]
MNNKISIYLQLLIFFIIVFSISGCEQNFTKTIYGQIVSKDNNEPIIDAKIVLEIHEKGFLVKENTKTYTFKIDKKGKFRIPWKFFLSKCPDIGERQFIVRASAEGYKQQEVVAASIHFKSPFWRYVEDKEGNIFLLIEMGRN